MGKIVKLPRELIERIAAGEVVERPASVVKEVLENSLDAGADDILIEVEKGGKESIRITDNGSGMDSHDVKLAFDRYATSKIKSFEDLWGVRSFGFRGEALPSISAVARIEMLTRAKGAVSGFRIVVDGGKQVEFREAGCPEGTFIQVTELFKTVPARRKFLKSDSAEQGHCVDAVSRISLAHPHVRIRLNRSGRTILNAPRTSDLEERIALVLGKETRGMLLAVRHATAAVAISGFISRPHAGRSNGRGIMLFVNGRFAKDAMITHAVMNAYRGSIEAGRYPYAVLFLDLPPGDVDVNVHPAKAEVRFREPGAVYETVLAGVREALAGLTAADAQKPEPYAGNRNAASLQAGEAVRRYVIAGERGLFPRFSFSPSATAAPAAPAGAEKGGGFFSSLEYAGRIAGVYLVFYGDGAMILLDQHAAHERILFENLQRKSAAGPIPSVRLLVPELVQLSPSEYSILEGLTPVLLESGIEVGFLGTDTAVIKSVPDLPVRPDPASIIRDVIGETAELGNSPQSDPVRDRVFASLACRAAVKSGDRLSADEVRRLCEDLERCLHPSTCPHGRPLYIRFEIREIEKMFRRR